MVYYQPSQDWQQWVEWLAAGLHGRSRWRFSLILLGMVFASGRRTVTTWLRAAGIQHDFADYYYFLQPLGRKSKALAQRLWITSAIVTGHRRAAVVMALQGERQGWLLEPTFQRAIKVAAGDDRLTSDGGAILLRKADHRLGLAESLAVGMVDPRRPH